MVQLALLGTVFKPEKFLLHKTLTVVSECPASVITI